MVASLEKLIPSTQSQSNQKNHRSNGLIFFNSKTITSTVYVFAIRKDIPFEFYKRKKLATSKGRFRWLNVSAQQTTLWTFFASSYSAFYRKSCLYSSILFT